MMVAHRMSIQKDKGVLGCLDICHSVKLVADCLPLVQTLRMLFFLIKIPLFASALLALIYALAWLAVNWPILLALTLFVTAGWVGARLGSS